MNIYINHNYFLYQSDCDFLYILWYLLWRIDNAFLKLGRLYVIYLSEIFIKLLKLKELIVFLK